MAETKHTPGPWEWNGIYLTGRDGFDVIDPEVACTAYCQGGTPVLNISDADKGRIVSCVNALEGITEPEAVREAIAALRKIAKGECRCFYDADWWLNNEPQPTDGGHTEDCPVTFALAVLARIDGGGA